MNPASRAPIEISNTVKNEDRVKVKPCYRQGTVVKIMLTIWMALALGTWTSGRRGTFDEMRNNR